MRYYEGTRGIFVGDGLRDEAEKLKSRGEKIEYRMGILALYFYLTNKSINAKINKNPLRVTVIDNKNRLIELIPKTNAQGMIMITTQSKKWKIGDIFVAVKLAKTKKAVFIQGWLSKGDLLKTKPKYVMGQLVRMPKKSTYRTIDELIMTIQGVTYKKREDNKHHGGGEEYVE